MDNAVPVDMSKGSWLAAVTTGFKRYNQIDLVFMHVLCDPNAIRSVRLRLAGTLEACNGHVSGAPVLWPVKLHILQEHII